MKLDLKIPWFTRTPDLERDLNREFSNIHDLWNSHDSGTKAWTKFTVLGAFSLSPRAVTASTSLSETDNVIFANSTSGIVTLTLPSAIGIRGRIYIVKRTNAGNNFVRIVTVLSQTIDGASSYSLPWQYHSISVMSDGANWMILF